MQALKLESGEKYVCAHWRSFPPLGAGEDEETLRRNKAITDEQYSHLLIWKRDCGLMEMLAGKCMTCPHRRKIEWRGQGPVVIDPKGVVTAIVDMATGEASSHNRFPNIFRKPGTRGNHQTTAWKPGDKPNSNG